MNLLTASHLRRAFGTSVAVDDVSLTIAPGEIYGLVGSDGAGKTTTIRLLVGALKPDMGQVTICEYDVARQTEQARSFLGYLSQRFSLYEDLTVLENIRFFAELRGLSQKEWQPRCMGILEFVGLGEFSGRRAGQLSGGMRQKLGLASALVTRPQLLLLDEPTTGVDPVTRQDFWKLIIRLVSSPISTDPNTDPGETSRRGVLITTPYMDEASRCHRVGFMRSGRIIAEGTPTELRARLDGRIVEVRGGSTLVMRQLALAMDGVEDVRLFGDRLHLRLQVGRSQAVIESFSAPLATLAESRLQARLIPPTLEDVFIWLADS